MVLAFGVIAAPIAYGLLSDAKALRARQADEAKQAAELEKTQRLERLLTAMQSSERDAAFTAVRTMTTYENDKPVTVIHRVYGDAPMKRKLEFMGVEGAPEERRAKPPAFSPFTFLIHIQGALAGPGLQRPGGLTTRFTDVGLLVKNYDVVSIGTEAVAGRDADVYDLQPRHPGRVSYRLWSDRATRFPLRYQVRRESDIVFESSTRSIAFAPPGVKFPAPRQNRLIDVDPQPIDDPQELAVHLKFKSFLPAELPGGFRLCDKINAVRAKVPGVDDPFWALSATYTDGIASLMLLEFDANNKLWKQVQLWLAGLGDAPPTQEKGKIVAQRVSSKGGCAIRMTIEGTEIIASGQVSPEDLERMVRSLKRIDGRSE
jgi:hypothetical protein